MTTLLSVDPSQVLPYVGKIGYLTFTDQSGENWKVSIQSDRLLNFKHYGTRCVCCGIDGSTMILQKHKKGPPHFGLYAVTGCGEQVLITVDHIVAKSKNGPSHLKNYQTMCQVCNLTKGPHSISDMRFLRKVVNMRMAFRSVDPTSANKLAHSVLSGDTQYRPIRLILRIWERFNRPQFSDYKSRFIYEFGVHAWELMEDTIGEFYKMLSLIDVCHREYHTMVSGLKNQSRSAVSKEAKTRWSGWRLQLFYEFRSLKSVIPMESLLKSFAKLTSERKTT